MIPADQLELITAAVDGELSATEARAFRRLLDASPEARALYGKLRADSARVQALPRVAPPVNLRTRILARVAHAPVKDRPQPAQPAQPATRRLPARRIPAWVPAAVAASVFLCVTAGSFAFFNGQSRPQNTAVRNPWSNALPAPQDAPPAVPSPTATAPNGRSDPDAVVRLDVSPVPPLPQPRPVLPESVAIAPEPRPAQHDLIGSRILPSLPPFDRIQVRIPFLRTVAELDRDDVRHELTAELGHGATAFRIDLFVRDTVRGAEVFQNAAKATGLTVHADALTADRLKKRQVASVMIYTESLTPAEVSDLFAKLCTEDMKFSPRVCDSLHATAAVRADELELKAILGTDVGLFKHPANTPGSGGTGQGGDKPVSAGTIESVAKSLNTPASKGGEKHAALLTWQTSHPNLARTNPTTSAELKQYLAKRGPRKPGAVPVVIVIRPVG
jgi:anti-sigma factor RsiW